ncbi:MAG TPA: PxKF domain-containing protein [Anaerolineales bacterium]|nr:PxKF domain-containing protein [Anaerolineales bacterium]
MKNKFSIALSLAVIVAMLVTSLALADAATSQSISINNGATDTGSLSVMVNVSALHCPPGGDMQALEVAFRNSSSDPWTVVHATDTPWPGGDADGCNAGNAAPASFAWTLASGADGSRTVYARFKHAGDEVFADDNINFVAPASDTTAPVITYTVNDVYPAAPDGLNGWFVSDVSVDWTVTDPESSFTTVGCVDITINSDTAGTTLNCSATSAGGTAGPVTVTIKRDATVPSVTVTPDRVPDHNGWYNAAVTFDTNGTDGPSGVASCSADQTYSEPDGTDLTVSGSCTDNAGNVGNGVSDAFDFDDTNPTITWHDVQNFYYGFPPATAPSCEASDDLSGPDDCSVAGYNANAATGVHGLTATAHDVAGNEATASSSYNVLAWTLKGFYQPVDMGGNVWNTVKGGSTVPLKFELFAGLTELKLTSYVTGFTAEPVACPTNGYVADAIEVTATGGTSLRFDTTGDQFIYNWQTPKKPGACYTITMTAKDGSTLSANFILK